MGPGGHPADPSRRRGHDYIDLRASQEQLDIARRNLDTQRQTVEVTRERFRLGLTSQLDVAQAEGQAASTAADIPAWNGTSRPPSTAWAS